MFKHDGRTAGQGAVSTGPAGKVADTEEETAVVPETTGPLELAPDTTGPLELVVAGGPTGQIVVEIGTVTVVRTVEDAGQLVTSGPQLMMVETDVVKMVEVVREALGVVSATTEEVVVCPATEDEVVSTTSELVVVCPATEDEVVSTTTTELVVELK